MTTESCHPEEQLQATIAEHPRRGKGHVLSMDPVGGGQAPSPTVFLLLEPDPSAMKPPQDDKVCCHPEEQLQATIAEHPRRGGGIPLLILSAQDRDPSSLRSLGMTNEPGMTNPVSS